MQQQLRRQRRAARRTDAPLPDLPVTALVDTGAAAELVERIDAVLQEG